MSVPIKQVQTKRDRDPGRAFCPYSDQLLVTRKFWSPGANRPSQANAESVKKPPPFDPSLYMIDELRQMREVMLMIARRQGLLREEDAEGVEPTF
jgi:hypothetical protein